MLSIKNVHKRFGDVHAMNDITLDLKPGLFGLLGPNGAGKSTLMRTLATLQKPDEGTITYNGTDIVSKPDVMRATLGYLPQDFGVYPRMSAEALLDHIAILKGVNNKAERRGQILSLLHSVDLFKHKTASVATFSGGMRQRFGVAQALLGDPKVLIVDDMAIIGEGQVIARGAPESLIDKIRNSVWRKKVDKDQVAAIKSAHRVLATRLLMGGVVISVLSDEKPAEGFEQADPTLEDAYFAHLYNFV